MAGRRALCVIFAIMVGAVPSLIAGPADAASNPMLSVTISGQGSVSTGDGEIACPKVCSSTGYKPGTTVVLTASPAEGWGLRSWTGGCAGRKLSCTLTIGGDTSVGASFFYTGLSDPGAVGFGDLLADGGASGTTSVKLKALVGNLPPRAVLAAPPVVKAGVPVHLSATGSKDPDGRIVGYRWDLNGDGVYDDGFGPHVVFDSLAVGTHIVRLEVADNDWRVVPTSRTIRVAANPALVSTADRLRSEGSTRPLRGGFDGLSGWRHFGSAFASPIVKQGWISASRVIDANGRLNGTYADDVHVGIGATGRWATSFRPDRIAGLTANAAAAMATGELVSQPLRITRRYLAFGLGGGGRATSAERLELWVQTKSRWLRALSYVPGEFNEVLRPGVFDLAKLKGRRAAIVVIDNATTAWVNVDNLRQSNARPRTAQDSSYFRVAPKPRTRYVPPAPIVGFADFHSHPAAAQGFGALQGIRAYMGTAGAAVTTYDSDPTAFAHDVYGDDVYHFGGPLAKFGIDLAEGRVDRTDTNAALASLVGSHAHPRYGGACNSTTTSANAACADPGHQAGTIGPAHEQMNVFEIHRAWEGGLRLLSSLAINSSVLEYLASYPVRYDGGEPETDIFGAPTEHNGDQSVNVIATTPENQVIAAEALGTRQLAAVNSSWMEIAYNPQQAYDIARSGKLAIVLGTEIDTTGALGFATPQDEVNWLWSLGIRQVTPIHCCDSRIGGSALFQDAYNTANDFQNRPTKNITAIRASDDYTDQGLAIDPKPGASSPPQVGYFLHAVAGCQYPNNDRGECINWRFDSMNGTGTVTSPHGTQSVAVIDGNALTTLSGVGVYTVHPAPYDRFPSAAYTYYDRVSGGMRNPQGLTDYGRAYIEALMNRGMLIDMEHMSEQTIDDLVDPGTAAGHTRGPVWSFDPGSACSVTANFTVLPRAGDCWSYAYPLMSSHTSFRAQSLLPGSETDFKGFVSREFERSSNQVEYIRRSGGVLGPVVLQDPVDTITGHVPYASDPTAQLIDHYDWATTSHPTNSCAGSSESWAQAYLYSVQKMGGRGVGLGTDMLLVGGTAPRFGTSSPSHLGAIYSCDDSRETGNIAQEEAVDSAQYQRSAQRNPVVYGGAFSGLAPGSGALRPDVDPAGVFKDMNHMGMVAYGELPDMLQDATNVGVTAHDLTPLFSSAQSYVDMWDKAYVVAGCYADDFDRCGASPSAVADRGAVCQGTCPLNPGRGLGDAPNGHPYVVTLPAGIVH